MTPLTAPLKSLLGDWADLARRTPATAASPAQALRERLAGARIVTLVDPADRCAPDVMHALAEATGRPLERWRLRGEGQRDRLADVEHAVVPRRGDAPLAVVRPDVPADATDPAAVSLSLMAASDLAVLIVDALEPATADRLLAEIDAAVAGAEWRCPALLFLLPPRSSWLVARIAGYAWPARLAVRALEAPPEGPAALWNRVLAAWERLHEGGAHGAAPGDTDAWLDPTLIERQLSHLLQLDGVLGCALVDTASGALLAGDQRRGDLELGVAAAACAHVMRAQLDAARLAGLARPIDELTVSAGAQQQVMRPLTGRDGLFLLALLDRDRANLALTRFRMSEAQKSLL